MSTLRDSLRAATPAKIQKPVFEEDIDLASMPDSMAEAWALIDEINAWAATAQERLSEVAPDLLDMSYDELFAQSDEIMSNSIYQ